MVYSRIRLLALLWTWAICVCRGLGPSLAQFSQVPSVILRLQPSTRTRLAATTHSDPTKAPLIKSTRRGLLKSTAVSLMIFGSAAAASAASPAVFDASVFTGNYNDPVHPLCGRHIEVSKDGTKFHYSGTAVGGRQMGSDAQGCSPSEVKQFGGLRTVSGDGTISNEGTIALQGRVGTWEEASSETEGDGIRWSDGTKWTVKETDQATGAGAAIFYAYVGASLLAGLSGVAGKIRSAKSD